MATADSMSWSGHIWLLAFATTLTLAEEEYHGEHGDSDGEEQRRHVADRIRPTTRHPSIMLDQLIGVAATTDPVA